MKERAWIEMRELSKTFGNHHALVRLSLRVGAGEVYGLLGPNGSGKTTSMRILMGGLIPDSGNAQICGLDCHRQRVQVKRVAGYLPDVPNFL
jgi:ABC-2 type transport system ATP-binding protein